MRQGLGPEAATRSYLARGCLNVRACIISASGVVCVDVGALLANWCADNANGALGDFDTAVAFAATRKDKRKVLTDHGEVADTTEGKGDGAVVMVVLNVRDGASALVDFCAAKGLRQKLDGIDRNIGPAYRERAQRAGMRSTTAIWTELSAVRMDLISAFLCTYAWISSWRHLNGVMDRW